jgi:hypothetical protein
MAQIHDKDDAEYSSTACRQENMLAQPKTHKGAAANARQQSTLVHEAVRSKTERTAT